MKLDVTARHAFAMAAIMVGLWGSISTTAEAHFIYLNTERSGESCEVRLYFSETSHKLGERLPERIAAAAVWKRLGGGERVAVDLHRVEGDEEAVYLAAPLDHLRPCAIEARCDYGVYQSIRLTYFAKHLLCETPEDIPTVSRAAEFDLDISAKVAGDEMQLTVHWKGNVAPETEVVIVDPQGKSTDLKTDAQGRIHVPFAAEGMYSARAHFVQAKVQGEIEGQQFDGAHDYATLTWHKMDAKAGRQSSIPPAVPQAIASFGATLSDGTLYVYGGHTGAQHEHSSENVTGKFYAFSFGTDASWRELPGQTPLQGLALVAHHGRVYRVGGMDAKNKPGEDEDLHSSRECACFDPETNQWSPLPDLPIGRSSHDAVVIAGQLYVVGGWELSGNPEGNWHDDALVLDLDAPSPQWKTVPAQPFRRRAIACGTQSGKLFVIGGMDPTHVIDRSVDVFDPATQTWTAGPRLPGEGMNGFGASAWNHLGSLYVSGSDGVVYRLASSGEVWEACATLSQPRFFHRLVSGPGASLLAIGGAAHGVGHLANVEIVKMVEPTVLISQ